MRFSVIIPTYNRAAFIEDTVHAVLQQTFTDFEVVVVDDGSTDNTRETIGKIKSERLRYFYKRNEERSIARNYGAEKATGEYLIFLDSDDQMLPSHLQNLSEYIVSAKGKPEFLCTGYSVVNKAGVQISAFTENGIFGKEKLAYGNDLCCSPVAVNAEIFRENQFNSDPNIIVFEDWELWLRLIDQYDLHCIPQQTIRITHHEERSVLEAGHQKLENKVLFFRNTVLSKINFIKQSGQYQEIFLSGVYSYAALHIGLTRENKAKVLRYLFLALRHRPSFIFRRRFFAIIKLLF
jgi:glycosyltransferase involved in cell wall biosynthesis